MLLYFISVFCQHQSFPFANVWHWHSCLFEPNGVPLIRDFIFYSPALLPSSGCLDFLLSRRSNSTKRMTWVAFITTREERIGMVARKNKRRGGRTRNWTHEDDDELPHLATDFPFYHPLLFPIHSSVRLSSLSYGTVLVWAHHRQLGVAPCRQQHIPMPLNAFNRIVYFRRTASYTVGGGEVRRGSLQRREQRKLKNINYHTDCLKLCAHVVNPTIIPAEDKTKF